jgi:hypothetical protein
MKRLFTVTLAAAAVTLAIAGAAVAQEGKPQAEERLASFEMAWPKLKTEAITARARAAAEVMTGQQLSRPAVVAPIKSSGTSSRRMQIALPGAPALEIFYLPEYNELRIVDTELAASTTPGREMPQDEALKLARRAFDELARRNVIDPRHYDWGSADTASTWVGGGSLDGKTSEKNRIEYRITVRRSINGIEVANAGVRIAIHASGRVSALRLGGVEVASKTAGDVEEPIGKGRWLSRRVANKDLQARFEREMVPEKAKAKIAWSRVMYVMPENKRTALVEPLYVVSYSMEFPSDDGQTAISRRKTVGFSLVNPEAPPVDLMPPARTPKIEKMRKPEAKR